MYLYCLNLTYCFFLSIILRLKMGIKCNNGTKKQSFKEKLIHNILNCLNIMLYNNPFKSLTSKLLPSNV